MVTKIEHGTGEILIARDTGEILNETEIAPLDAALPDDDVLGVIASLKAAINCYRECLGRAEMEMTKRLQDRQATVYFSERWDVKLVPQVEYKYDTKLLSMLSFHLGYGLTAEEFAAALKWEPKVSKVELNKLVKRGGKIKEIIENATTTIEKAPRLEIREVGP